MITAQQARDYRLSKPYMENLNELYRWIEIRARQGFDRTWVDDKLFTDEQLAELQANGYIVTIDNERTYKITW